MDKLVDHYFVFEGDGEIRDHHGTYMEYRDIKDAEEAEQRRIEREKKSPPKEDKKAKSKPKKKKSDGLSYKERKEFNKLEKEIAKLEEEKTELEKELASGNLDPEELQEKSERYGEISDEIDGKSMVWLEMAERDEE